MLKDKTVFFCKECGYESAKWLGQCPACKAWDSFVEAPAQSKKRGVGSAASLKSSARGAINGGLTRNVPVKLSDIVSVKEHRDKIGIEELDRVLGGGIVKGSLVLVGGDPGIGKSTLLLQMSGKLSDNGKKVLYVSGEESLKQVKLRADRLGEFKGPLSIISETDLDIIESAIENSEPDVVVVDSIQTMYRGELDSAPGSVGQVRETTATLMRIAKSLEITIFIIGHVTKEGTVAGPKVLEHMVDTVLYFEGSDFASYRILRAVKNRFGRSNEIGVFEMEGAGLAEVKNPSEYMLAGMPDNEPGSIVAATLEGTRTILVEVQSLVAQTNMNIPRRTSTGADYNRVGLLIAVIEKRLGIKLSFCDVFINIAGGLRINEPAVDLAIVVAILSSYYNKPIEKGVVVFGEVGLTGEVRAVTQAKDRVEGALKMGYSQCIMPEADKTSRSMQNYIKEKVEQSRERKMGEGDAEKNAAGKAAAKADGERNSSGKAANNKARGMKLIGISNIRDLVSFFQS